MVNFLTSPCLPTPPPFVQPPPRCPSLPPGGGGNRHLAHGQNEINRKSQAPCDMQCSSLRCGDAIHNHMSLVEGLHLDYLFLASGQALFCPFSIEVAARGVMLAESTSCGPNLSVDLGTF